MIGKRMVSVFWIACLAAGLIFSVGPQAATAADGTVKIGVPAPYSGSAAEKGKHLKYGIIRTDTS